MSTPGPGRIRAATAADADALLRLWAGAYEGHDGPAASWQQPARLWFSRQVEDGASARFPVIEVDGAVVATAIGTLELGVPNPHCPRGRTVRLANVVTAPEHRRRGYASWLVLDVIGWARSIGADRVDLSATPDGQRVYQRAGFVLTHAPRLKLVL